MEKLLFTNEMDGSEIIDTDSFNIVMTNTERPKALSVIDSKLIIPSGNRMLMVAKNPVGINCLYFGEVRIKYSIKLKDEHAKVDILKVDVTNEHSKDGTEVSELNYGKDNVYTFTKKLNTIGNHITAIDLPNNYPVIESLMVHYVEYEIKQTKPDVSLSPYKPTTKTLGVKDMNKKGK